MADARLPGGRAAIHSAGGIVSLCPEEEGERCRRQQEQQQQRHNAGSSKSRVGCDTVSVRPAEPILAVQVVDRLRWWRTHRLREQPVPLHHVILRGNYMNYSSAGVRPFSPRLLRLLQEAKRILREWRQLEHQQEHPRQALQESGDIAASSEEPLLHPSLRERLPIEDARDAGPGDEGMEQQRDTVHPHPHVCTPAERPITPDNKRASGQVSPLLPLMSRSPPPLQLSHMANDEISVETVKVLRSPTSEGMGAAPPTRHAAAETANSSTGGPRRSKELTVQAAERLLMAYRPRATSVPLRSHRRHATAAHNGLSSSVIDGDVSATQRLADFGVEVTHHGSGTLLSTPDAIVNVRGFTGAANTAVVLHHAPRLVLFQKGLPPRKALRAAGISTDALEALDGSAAESSTDVFSLTNLPLSPFECFFYQQQLRAIEEAAGSPAELRCSPSSAEERDADEDVRRRPCTNVDDLRGAKSCTVTATASVAVAAVQAPGSTVEGGRRKEILYFGSPLTSAPAMWNSEFPSPSQVAKAMGTSTHTLSCADQTDVDPVLRTAWGQKGRGRAPLRSVSVPALPCIYKNGYPSMHPESGRHYRRSGALRRSLRPNASSGQFAEVRRTGGAPPADAHLCRRVDDLQDFYVFHPVVDMIGKGAFSKVYAAVPILRGRGGLKLLAPSQDGGTAASFSCSNHTNHSEVDGEGEGKVLRPPRRSEDTVHLPSMVSTTSLNSRAEASPDTAEAARRRTGMEDLKSGRMVSASVGSARPITVVALKVIPRKARPHSPQRCMSKALFKTPTASTATTAAKAVQLHTQPGEEDNGVRRELVEIEREVSILRRLHHTGCAQFYEALRTPDSFVIAMRIFPGSLDLRNYLARYGPPSETRAALMLFQLVTTIQYLHLHFGLIHRDIKLENLLVSELDANVSESRLREVLGAAAHKSDTTAPREEGDGHAIHDRSNGMHDTATTAASGRRSPGQLGSRVLTPCVSRLLRVTLIDFGLARRTRATASPITAALQRDSVQPHKGTSPQRENLATLTTSPPHGDPIALPVPRVGSPFFNQKRFSTSDHENNSTGVGPAASLSPCNLGYAAGHGGHGGCAHLAMMGVPSRGLSSCRTPSWALGTSRSRMASGGPSATDGIHRMGMPTPLPSTANMFTHFLDQEEDVDEEEDDEEATMETSLGGGTAPRVNAVSAAAVVGSRGHEDPPEVKASHLRDDSGVYSTDVSASETGSEEDSILAPDEDVVENEEGGVCDASFDGLSAHQLEAHPTPSPREGSGAGSTPTDVAMTAPPAPQVPPSLPEPISLCGNASPNDGVSRVVRAGFEAEPRSQGWIQSRSLYCTLQHQRSSLPDNAEATLLLTPCGTEKYLPPEVLNYILERGWARRFTTVALARAMDLWAVGIVAYVLLSGCFPFNASSRATMVQQQQRVPRCNSTRWSGVSRTAISFVQRLLEPNPLKRMTASEALEHPFLMGARQLAMKLMLVPHGEDTMGAAEGAAPYVDRKELSFMDIAGAPASRHGSAFRYNDPACSSHSRPPWSMQGMGTSEPTAATTYANANRMTSPTVLADRIRGAAPFSTERMPAAMPSLPDTPITPTMIVPKTGLPDRLRSSSAERVGMATACATIAGTPTAAPLSLKGSFGGSGGAFLHRVEGTPTSVACASDEVRPSLGVQQQPYQLRETVFEDDKGSSSILYDVSDATPPQQLEESIVPSSVCKLLTSPASLTMPSTDTRSSPDLAARPREGTAPPTMDAPPSQSTKSNPLCACAPPRSSPLPRATMTPNVKSGGNDLFEALYHDMMLDD